jgi:D-amino peptidase
VRGARAGGATEIVVMDCHGAGEGWTFNSLIPEELDPDCEYVVQNEWTEYVEYLESGVDAALFVGMHAMAGTRDGVLAHTVSGSSWWRLRFNGVEVGETGINAALCGTWGCPVVLVTGDEAACREGTALLGDRLTTVAVKKGLGRFSARQVPAPKARELIEEGARRALEHPRAVDPYDPGSPCEIVVDFNTSDSVEKYRYNANVEITSSRQIASRADDWWTAWRQFFF